MKYEFLYVAAIKSKKGKYYMVGHVRENSERPFGIDLIWIEVTEIDFNHFKDNFAPSDLIEVQPMVNGTRVSYKF